MTQSEFDASVASDIRAIRERLIASASTPGAPTTKPCGCCSAGCRCHRHAPKGVVRVTCCAHWSAPERTEASVAAALAHAMRDPEAA